MSNSNKRPDFWVTNVYQFENDGPFDFTCKTKSPKVVSCAPSLHPLLRCNEEGILLCLGCLLVWKLKKWSKKRDHNVNSSYMNMALFRTWYHYQHSKVVKLVQLWICMIMDHQVLLRKYDGVAPRKHKFNPVVEKSKHHPILFIVYSSFTFEHMLEPSFYAY